MTRFGRLALLAITVLVGGGYVAQSLTDFHWYKGFPHNQRNRVEALRADGRLPRCDGELRMPVSEFRAQLGACFRGARLEEDRVLAASDPWQRTLVLVYACQSEEFAARFLLISYQTERQSLCSYDLADDLSRLLPPYDEPTTAFLAHDHLTLLAQFMITLRTDLARFFGDERS